MKSPIRSDWPLSQRKGQHRSSIPKPPGTSDHPAFFFGKRNDRASNNIPTSSPYGRSLLFHLVSRSNLSSKNATLPRLTLVTSAPSILRCHFNLNLVALSRRRHGESNVFPRFSSLDDRRTRASRKRSNSGCGRARPIRWKGVWKRHCLAQGLRFGGHEMGSSASWVGIKAIGHGMSIVVLDTTGRIPNLSIEVVRNTMHRVIGQGDRLWVNRKPSPIHDLG
jgi:hypothetical protein